MLKLCSQWLHDQTPPLLRCNCLYGFAVLPIDHDKVQAIPQKLRELHSMILVIEPRNDAVREHCALSTQTRSFPHVEAKPSLCDPVLHK